MLTEKEIIFWDHLDVYCEAFDDKLGVKGITLNQRCYIMATVKHETATTFESLEEYDGDERYYAPHWGRGYVQLTHEENYDRIGKYLYSRGLLLSKDSLVKDPDLVLNPHLSMIILLLGMYRGWFSGVCLNDFILDGKFDPIGARKIVNGTDCAEKIARYYEQYKHEFSK